MPRTLCRVFSPVNTSSMMSATSYSSKCLTRLLSRSPLSANRVTIYPKLSYISTLHEMNMMDERVESVVHTVIPLLEVVDNVNERAAGVAQPLEERHFVLDIILEQV